MSYQDLVKKGLLRPEKIGLDQINKVIERAHRNIASAKVLIKHGDEEGSFRFAYEAMLLASRALVFSYGLRPRSIGSHKIVIDFTEKVLGQEYKILVQKFNKMRKKRNYLIYGIGLVISKTEAENALKTAQDFITKITKVIQNKSGQKKLFKRSKI